MWLGPQVPGNDDGDRFDIAKHVFVAKSNDFPSPCLNETLSSIILFVHEIVIAAIDFHHELSLEAREISDERFNRELTPKLESAQSSTT